jgi:hypothetical protein
MSTPNIDLNPQGKRVGGEQCKNLPNEAAIIIYFFNNDIT